MACHDLNAQTANYRYRMLEYIKKNQFRNLIGIFARLAKKIYLLRDSNE